MFSNNGLIIFKYIVESVMYESEALHVGGLIYPEVYQVVSIPSQALSGHQ